MNKRFLVMCSLGLCAVTIANAQDRKGGDPKLSEYYEPAAPVVAPGKTASDAPADAIISLPPSFASIFCSYAAIFLFSGHAHHSSPIAATTTTTAGATNPT